MASGRKRAQGTDAETQVSADEGTERRETRDASGYEQSRDRRSEQNKEKMQKLGIINLSLELECQNSFPKRSSKNPPNKKSEIPPLPGSSRRSSRLKTLAPVIYKEDSPERESSSSEEDLEIRIREGSKPEIYTDASGYEQSRIRRIEQNKEKMQKLGLFDLSLELKSQTSLPKRSSKNPPKKKSEIPPLPGSPRRSSRLKTLAPVSYKEDRSESKRGSSEEDLEIRIREGSKPEIYTEAHEKLLGDCKTAWTLLVDGYGEDGKRIYDHVNGETCHQCRQKTIGLHTHCSKCDLVQGQFCGDCLYTRYGENVIEVNENPSWICPVCRDICNCSLCRKAKEWMPTGQIYKKVFKLGYKSVAHYLIQTRHYKTKAENLDAVVPAERSSPSEQPFPQDEVHYTGEESEDLMHGDLEEEVDKVQLLDKKHVDGDDGGDKDDVLKEKKNDKGDNDV